MPCLANPQTGERRLGRAAGAAARRPRAGGDPHRRRRHPGADRRAARAGGGAGARRARLLARAERALRRWSAASPAGGPRRRGGWSASTAIAYAGNHGLELLLPGDEAPRLDPSLAGREQRGGRVPRRARRRASSTRPGLRLEDKGPIQALHWRGAADEAAAEARAHEIAAEAGQAGLEPHWGRKVLELRPVGGGGKDAAVASLLAGERRRPPPPTPATTAPTSTPSAACASCARRGELETRGLRRRRSRRRRRRSWPRSPT